MSNAAKERGAGNTLSSLLGGPHPGHDGKAMHHKFLENIGRLKRVDHLEKLTESVLESLAEQILLRRGLVLVVVNSLSAGNHHQPAVGGLALLPLPSCHPGSAPSVS